ncbi:hypothetical protein Sjap_004838 [Stephania japonica]|uniref:Uncharacterized protein n=1 Tax=Stephania japonica TaxID=461633 RepID=A0AAP0K3Y6_9MAGN
MAAPSHFGTTLPSAQFCTTSPYHLRTQLPTRQYSSSPHATSFPLATSSYSVMPLPSSSAHTIPLLAPSPSNVEMHEVVRVRRGKMIVLLLDASNICSRELRRIFKGRMHIDGYQWRNVPEDINSVYWEGFTKHFTYRKSEEAKIYEAFLKKVAKRNAALLYNICKKLTSQPSYLTLKIYDNYLAQRSTPEFKEKTKKFHKIKSLRKEGLVLGRPPTASELYDKVYMEKYWSTFFDQRSKTLYDKFLRLRDEALSQRDLESLEPLIDEDQIIQMQSEMQEERECQQKAMQDMEARHQQDRESHQRDLERSRKEMQDHFARLEELISEDIHRRYIRPTSSPIPHYDLGQLRSSKIGINIREDVHIPQAPYSSELLSPA